MKHKKLIGIVLIISGIITLIAGILFLILTEVNFSFMLIVFSIILECAGITIISWKSSSNDD